MEDGRRLDWRREREGWRAEGGIIMVGGYQGEREKRGEQQREGKKDESEEERGSPAHSAKTIQLVNEGAHSTLTEGEREGAAEVKRGRERNSLHMG